MYRDHMRYAVLLVLVIFATGCAGEPDVYSMVQDRAYSPSEFRFASQHKDFPTYFVGNPFSQPEDQVHESILAAMQPVNWWFSEAFTPRTRFTDKPTGPPSPYRVNVVLDPPGNVDPARYCAKPGDTDTKPRAGKTVSARMAFCRNETLLSMSRGSVENIDSPADPRFRRMITRMTMGLFPQRRDNDRDCGPLKHNRSC